jgi:hypothetical protein
VENMAVTASKHGNLNVGIWQLLLSIWLQFMNMAINFYLDLWW